MTLSFPHNSRNPASRPAPAKTGAAAPRESAPAKKKPPETPRPAEETAGEDAPDLGLFPRRIKSTEIIYTTSQLAVMVETGINLSAALNSIAEQEENPTLKAVLTDLKQRVEQGEDFSVALARHPKHFDKIYIALIKASEQTGALAEMLESISEYQRAQLETRQKVQGAMAYPAVMFVIAIGVTTFLLTFVLPKFTPLFAKKGVKLPLPTVVLMALSDAIVGYWPFLDCGNHRRRDRVCDVSPHRSRPPNDRLDFYQPAPGRRGFP
jgi:type II secretory pathway component PulF